LIYFERLIYNRIVLGGGLLFIFIGLRMENKNNKSIILQI